MEAVAATAPIKQGGQPSPAKPGLLEGFGINVTELARRGRVILLLAVIEEIVRIEISTAAPKIIPVLIGGRSRKNSRGGRPGPENC